MAKPEWGQKRTCGSCGAKFYDLLKNPPVCPKCGAVYEVVAAPKPRRQSSVAKKEAVTKVKEETEEEEVETDEDLLEEDDEDSEDEDIMEDTSDLGEDDDDMTEVMEHVETERQDD
ncbi:MAG: TIGR02300 family protein [Rhodospirillaceae bacterium]